MVVDEIRARSFLATRFGGEVVDVMPVGQGEWSRAFFFRRGGRDFVIRFSPLEEDFAKDRIAVRYRDPHLPIPEILELGDAVGGFYAISERVSGDYLDHLDGTRMRRVLPSLLAALDAMRVADISMGSGYGIWQADGMAPHADWRAALLDVVNDQPGARIHGWRQRLASSSTGAEPFDRALREFKRLMDTVPNDRHLIHSDLLHFNVLVCEDRISAVIDWGCAMYGDFLYDVAWLSFWAPWYRAWDGINFAEEAICHYERIGLAVPYFEERLRCYELHIGLSGQAYCAFAGHWDDLEWTARRTLEIA